MYGLIKGKFHAESGCVLTSGGLGIAVRHCGDPMADEAEVTLFAHTAVSENDITVWTFDSVFDRQVFHALISAVGVGPTLAGGILGTLGGAKTVTAIVNADTAALSRAPKVGPGVARKIIASVKLPEGLVAAASVDSAGVSREVRDGAVEALMSYGFKKEAVLGILDSVDVTELVDEGEEVTVADVVRYVISTNQGG